MASSIRGQEKSAGRGASVAAERDDPRGLDAPRAADLAVALAGVHVADVEQGPRHVHRQGDRGAGGQLLDVEVAAVQAGPDVGPGLVLGAGADEAEHRARRASVRPSPQSIRPSRIGDDALLVADPRAPQPGGHGAVAAAEAGEADRVEDDRADVHGQDHAGLGPFDVNTAARGITAAKQGAEPGAVGVGVEPGAAVELGLDLERLAGLGPGASAGWPGRSRSRARRSWREAWNQASDRARCRLAAARRKCRTGRGSPLLPIGRLTIIARMLGVGTVFEVPGF